MIKDIPVVDAFQMKYGQLEMYCPYCKKWHRHGENEGHRVAHCVSRTPSPYKKTGYILKISGLKRSEIKAKAIASLKRTIRKSGKARSNEPSN